MIWIKFLKVSTLSASLMFALVMGCGKSARPDAIFFERLGELGSWREEKVRRSVPEIIEYLGCRIRNEPNHVCRMALYAICTNAIVNLPLIATNVTEAPSQPMIGLIHHGIIGSPYSTASKALDNLAIKIGVKSGMTKLDLFCLRLEVWKRLVDELGRSDEMIDLWMARKHPADSKNKGLTRFLKEDSKRAIQSAMYDIEHELEKSCTSGDEDGRIERELFSAVIGRSPRSRVTMGSCLIKIW